MFQIWRFEAELIEACRTLLGDALQILNCHISPHIFLIGIDLNTSRLIVLPENAEITNEELEQYFSLPEPWVVPFPDDDLSDDAWREALSGHELFGWKCWSEVKDAMNSICLQNGKLVSVSPCRELNGYMICLVAMFDAEQHDGYPTLDSSILTEHGRWPSLHFGVVDAVLNEFADELRMRDAGRRLGNETKTGRGILRAAGEFFARNHFWAEKHFSKVDIKLRGTLDFFEACNSISAMPYEMRVGLGKMIVVDRMHPAVNTIIELEKPFLATHFRRVRKLLEMCQENMSVLTDSRYVWGLGEFLRDKYDPRKADIMTIGFLGHSHWQLAHLGCPLMEVKYGEPRLPRPTVDPRLVPDALKRRFTDISDATVSSLMDIVGYALQAEHGTMLVISTNAATESARLAGKNRGIRSFRPGLDTIAAASSIDGAIMVDLDGLCHGIGLILDGVAEENADAGRGARFNSAIRYTNANQQCVIVVVSEDGMIDVLPTVAGGERQGLDPLRLFNRKT
jgi:hypothetical protein